MDSKKPQNGRRRPPEDMPSEIETIKRDYLQQEPHDDLPQQKALTDEPEQKPPAKWKAILKKIIFWHPACARVFVRVPVNGRAALMTTTRCF